LVCANEQHLFPPLATVLIADHVTPPSVVFHIVEKPEVPSAE
jgi:hypothetical protein